MNSDIAIKVENLGKKYQIGKVGKQLSIMEFVENFKDNIKRKKTEDFWALKDVNFEIKKGDVVGIIGRNGAGKSTLLKILSRITSPTTGKITLNGRVASLLEVGTGFNGELTGRENIYLNGSILGMTKKEIESKFDEIVEFSGVGKFIDTPVKRYSSGMYVRLAFAVAAHLESEILIVDEVLAVGDLEFQKKCLGKMGDVAKSGRTVLFVSHNIGSINRLCKHAILLKNGQIIKQGKTRMVTNFYTSHHNHNAVYTYKNNLTKKACITKVSILNKDHKPQSSVRIDEPFYIDVEYIVNQNIDKGILSTFFLHSGERILISTESDLNGQLKKYVKGKYRSIITIPQYTFNIGNMELDIRIDQPYIESYDTKTNIFFQIIGENHGRFKLYKGNVHGYVSNILNIKTQYYK